MSFTIAGPATINDHGDGSATVHLTGDLGQVDITAHQAGNESFDPAADVTRSFEVIDCSVVQDCTIDTAVVMQFDPASYQNVEDNDGVLTRDGGVAGTGDAFADSLDWVEGDGCGLWEWTITDPEECNLVNYFLYPEDASVGIFGWGFSNQLVDFRRAEFNNSVGGTLVFFRAAALGYNKFQIHYNNGTIRLLETAENATEDPGFIEPQSFAFNGLPTTTRWRLRVQVKNSAATCRSSQVRESIAGRVVAPE